MRKTFDVIEEPWIKAAGLDGSVSRISIREALTNSKNYRCLSLPTCLERAAMLRMLCAFDFRILYWYTEDGERRSVKDASDVIDRLKGMISRGGVTNEQVSAYVRDCNERAGFHTRFDALDDKMPFLQSTERRDGTETLAGKLKTRVLNSKNKARYHTPGDQNEPVCLEDALTALAAILSFDDAGVKTKPGDTTSGVGPVADHALVYFTGNSLLDDIVYNICLVDEDGNLYGDDKPVWEIAPMAAQVDVVKRKEDAEDPEKGRPRNSPAAFYAPRGRRPLLMLNENGMAVGIHNRFGDRFTQSTDAGFTDPMKLWARKDGSLFPLRVFRKDDSSPAWTLKRPVYELMHCVIGDVLPYDPEKEAEKKKEKEINPEDVKRNREGTARTPSVVTWMRRVMDMTGDETVSLNLQGLLYGPQSGCIADTCIDTVRIPKDAVREENEERKKLIRLCAGTEQIIYQAARFGTALDDIYHDDRQPRTKQMKNRAMVYAASCTEEAMSDGTYDEALRRIGSAVKKIAEDETCLVIKEGSPDKCEAVFHALSLTRGIVTNLEKEYTSNASASKRKGTAMQNDIEFALRKKMLSVIGKIQSNGYETGARKSIEALCRTTQTSFYTDAELSDLIFAAGGNDESSVIPLGSDAAKAAAFTLRMYGIHQKGKTPNRNPMHILNTKENGYRFTFGRAVGLLMANPTASGLVKKYLTAILSASSMEQMEIPFRSLVRALAKQNIPVDYSDLAVFVYRICYGTEEQKQNAVIRLGSDAFGRRTA